LQASIIGKNIQAMDGPPGPLRILIADDHPLIRRALRRDLERGGLEVCAEARTGAEAIEAALRERPDLCLLDVQMPGGGGLAATAEIRRSLPAAKVVLITAVPDETGVLAAARRGADGYLAKDVDPLRLPQIIRAVADGETAYPRRLLWPLLRALRQPG
jgi:two-component system, NarL family, nitrate/nitrite response regulator NarL